MIWLLMIVPVLLVGFLMAIPSLRRKTVWWEIAIPLSITALTIFICQLVAIKSATNDKEYWGHLGVKVVHEEPFSYDSECPEEYPCGTYNCGTSKSPSTCTRYCTRYVHCVEFSRRSCKLVDDRSNSYHISYGKYQEIAKRWENYQYKTGTTVTRSHGYTTKGDLYKRPGHGDWHTVYFPRDMIDKAEPIVREYTYENRLQTQSHWGKVSEEDRTLYDVFEYPSVPGGWRLQSILTNGPTFPKSDMRLQYYNAFLNTNKGGYKKVRLWLLVYKNQPQESAELQRSYWKNANKNEVVVMIGLNDSHELTWADIMAQTDDAKSEAMKIAIRDTLLIDIANGKAGWQKKMDDANMLKFVDFFANKVRTHYTKPSFEQYAYIQVQPSMFAIIISLIIVLAVNVGAGFFVVYNPWEEGGRRRRNRGYRFR